MHPVVALAQIERRLEAIRHAIFDLLAEIERVIGSLALVRPPRGPAVELGSALRQRLGAVGVSEEVLVCARLESGEEEEGDRHRRDEFRDGSHAAPERQGKGRDGPI